MKKLLLALATCLLMGCAEETVYADPPLPPLHPAYGCVIIEDDYGEREVCDVSYYISPYGPIYYDVFFGAWIGAGGYWYGGLWHHGFWPGYHARYRFFYHGHGFYHGYGHGYYGGHWGGHGGGGYHGGGGFHGGGGHGGHR